MDAYILTLKDKKEVAPGTMHFSFERPEDLDFKPGQYADFSLIDPAYRDNGGDTRTFSLSSAPSDDEIGITTRMRPSAFKKTLGDMQPGDTIKMSRPMGSFRLHTNEEQPAVFIAGGIGITPIRSIIRHTAETNPNRPMILLHTNRRPEDAPFADEFNALQDRNEQFQFVPVITQPQSDDEGAEQGYITTEMLQKYSDDLNKPMFYVVGSPRMVGSVLDTLEQSGISPDNIRTEDFGGY
jgi:ferredoxin-NADP reductase